MIIEELPEFLQEQQRCMTLTEYQQLRCRLLDGPMGNAEDPETNLREILMEFEHKSVLVSYLYYPAKERLVLVDAELIPLLEPIRVKIPLNPKPRGHAKP